MADVIRYTHPSDQPVLSCSFDGVTPSTDSSLKAIGSGSDIYAEKSDGKDASSILFSKTVSSLTMSVTLKNLVDGEEYLVTFLGQGTTSNERYAKTYQVLVRKFLTGEF